MITLRQVKEDMARLEAAMRAKGHEKASAEFEMTADGMMKFLLRTGPIGIGGERAFHTTLYARYDFAFTAGTSYAAVLWEAEREVAQMDKSVALACEAWFQVEAA